jgi:GNAT superfamily N-acetyltransferase
VRAIELPGVDSDEWRALQGEEPQPWGGEAEALAWADKTRHVGVRGERGELLALAGALVAEVATGGGAPFPVAGIGGVIVRPDMRGRGLAGLVIEAILDVARGLGPERAMLFCRVPLVALYERFGFRAIDDPVSAEQPGGRIKMPLRAMWAPLRPGAAWPDGDVAVLGEPF